MKPVTIKDVAKKLNVSISSVSRAFNDKYDIKKETRERILKVANEMGYLPNPIAQKLTQKKSFNVGVVVPEFVNEYYAEVIIGIQQVLLSKGYQVLIMQSDDTSEQELKNVKTLIHNFVDGLIICPAVLSENINFYMEEINKGYPIVFLNRVRHDLPVNKVLFDNFKWSFFATEHMIEQGYERIYNLSGNNNLAITIDRVKGFKKALEKHHFPKGNYKIIETGLLPEDGIAIVEKLIEKDDLPDAFVCVNDLVALGVINYLEQKNIKVPEDIGVIGFTETKMATFMHPKLSSVKQPTFEMGKSAAEILLKLINNEKVSEQTVVLNGSLNIRQSSLKQK